LKKEKYGSPIIHTESGDFDPAAFYVKQLKRIISAMVSRINLNISVHFKIGTVSNSTVMARL